jgi:hypothetical protein
MWKTGCLILLLSYPAYSQTNGTVDPLKPPQVVPNAQPQTLPKLQIEPTLPNKDGQRFVWTPGRTFNFVDNMQSVIHPPRFVPNLSNSKVCSIPLQQVPIQADTNFTIVQIPPPQIDAKMVVQPSVPACDNSSQSNRAPAPSAEPKK